MRTKFKLLNFTAIHNQRCWISEMALLFLVTTSLLFFREYLYLFVRLSSKIYMSIYHESKITIDFEENNIFLYVK